MAKKKLPKSCKLKRKLIEPHHPTLSIRRQCELIGLSRVTYYWQTEGETLLNLKLMRLIDSVIQATTFGSGQQQGSTVLVFRSS